MKRRTLIAALAAVVIAAAGVPGLAQGTWNTDRSLFVELEERHFALWPKGEVLSEFSILLDVASNGLAAPDAASQAAHAQTLLMLLVGPEDAGLDPQSLTPSLRWYVDSDVLVGRGGLMGAIERLGVAVDAYLEFARSNASLLCALWAEQAGVSDPTLFAAGVDTMVGRVSKYWERVSRLGQAALNAARRAAETADGDAVAAELATIYACAATAGGYGAVTTAEGPTPSSCRLLSTLNEFGVWVDDLYEELIDAFAAAQSSGG